jgi:hypothetical protein
MKVFADDSPVWQGSVGMEALSFEGPVGMRSDNAHLVLNFQTGQPTQQSPPGCRGQESE